jgi:hypothetical protein
VNKTRISVPKTRISVPDSYIAKIIKWNVLNYFLLFEKFSVGKAFRWELWDQRGTKNRTMVRTFVPKCLLGWDAISRDFSQRKPVQILIFFNMEHNKLLNPLLLKRYVLYGWHHIHSFRDRVSYFMIDPYIAEFICTWRMVWFLNPFSRVNIPIWNNIEPTINYIFPCKKPNGSAWKQKTWEKKRRKNYQHVSDVRKFHTKYIHNRFLLVIFFQILSVLQFFWLQQKLDKSCFLKNSCNINSHKLKRELFCKNSLIFPVLLFFQSFS